MRTAYHDYQPSTEVQRDCERIELLWAMARQEFGTKKPWLFGDYSIADAFYAPVAMRFAAYGLAQSDIAKHYMQAHLNHAPLRQWRAMGFAMPFAAIKRWQIRWPGQNS